jgi:hypothetical protein
MVMPMPAEWVVGDDDPGQGPGWHQEVLRGRPGRPGRDGGPGRDHLPVRRLLLQPSIQPEFAGDAQHTLGAFMVRDAEATVAELRGKGVRFEDYDLLGVKTVNGIAELNGIPRGLV